MNYFINQKYLETFLNNSISGGFFQHQLNIDIERDKTENSKNQMPSKRKTIQQLEEHTHHSNIIKIITKFNKRKKIKPHIKIKQLRVSIRKTYCSYLQTKK